MDTHLSSIGNALSAVPGLLKRMRGYALQNASKFKGVADPKNILGKILGEFPGCRSKVSETMALLSGIVKEVNSLSLEQQEAELSSGFPDLKETKKGPEKKELPRLRIGDTVPVFRFGPSPSGPMHIGHSLVLSLNATYAKEYSGRLILRLEDTNPTNIDPSAYESLPENGQWLTGNLITEVIIQSDRMELYYSKALEILEKGFSYTCTCSAEQFRDYAGKLEECPCRNKNPSANVKDWHRMLTDMPEGGAVMRFKTDMKHPNPAMRDFPLFRICEDAHPRQGKKYRVWPLMNFAVAVDDPELGVTHALRAKDHADNAKRQELIYGAMHWKVPQTMFVGRINFTEMDLSTSSTRKKIEAGEYSGWDDVRLPFLNALRRRGYQPEAFRRYALEVGLSLADKTVSNNDFFKAIDSFNREVIEPRAKRYFFIDNPVEITVAGAPKQAVELDLHPSNMKGGRKFITHSGFLLAQEDIDLIKRLRPGTLIRLMDCINLTVKEDKYSFDSVDYEKFKNSNGKILHWLPSDDAANIAVEVLMPDGTVRSGIGESGIDDLEEGVIVQLERFGFCKLDKKTPGKAVFCYGHK